MATVAAIIEELSSSPVATTRLAGGELRLAAGTELVLKLGAELLLRSPAAELVLEAGSTLALEKGSVLTVGEPSKEYGLLAQPLNTTRLTGLGLPFELRATLASIVAEQYERPIQDFTLSLDHFTQSTQAAVKAAGLFVGETSKALLQGFTANLSKWPIRGLTEPVATSYSVGQSIPDDWKVNTDGSVPIRSSHHLFASEPANTPWLTVKPFYEVEPKSWLVDRSGMIPASDGLLYVPAPQPPAKRLPPPQSGNFGIPPAQPEQPGGELLALLADALRTGRTQPSEVIRLVAQVAKLPPVAKLRAELAELENLEQAWLKAKRRQTVDRFAAGQNMSRATLYRRWERLRELRLLLEAWQ